MVQPGSWARAVCCLTRHHQVPFQHLAEGAAPCIYPEEEARLTRSDRSKSCNDWEGECDGDTGVPVQRLSGPLLLTVGTNCSKGSRPFSSWGSQGHPLLISLAATDVLMILISSQLPYFYYFIRQREVVGVMKERVGVVGESQGWRLSPGKERGELHWRMACELVEGIVSITPPLCLKWHLDNPALRDFRSLCWPPSLPGMLGRKTENVWLTEG